MLTRQIQTLAGVLLLLFLGGSMLGQMFIEQSDAYGIDTYSLGIFGSGISVHDWNQDGWDDLSVAMPGEGIRFYQNNEGTFDQVSFDLQGLNEVKQICWVDYDNDGDKDLFVNQLQSSLKLYQNTGDMNLVDVTESSNLDTTPGDGYGACWGDIDNDGNLDLYVCNYFFSIDGFPNYLYYNNGDGTFVEIGGWMGVDNGITPSLQSVFFDFDMDGDQDIFIGNDRYNYNNYLYRNNGEEFEDVTENLNLDDGIWSMSVSVDDFDNDNDLDMYISNNQFGNLLQQNQDGELFIDVAVETNSVIYAFSWGSMFLDVNNNGWKDLFVATAPIEDEYPGYHHLLLNNQGTFVIPNLSGFGLENENTYSCAKGDFDNDGYVDMVTHSSDPLGTQLWINTGNGLNYLKVGLSGLVSNRDGIGSIIRAWKNGESKMEYTMCGEGYLSQHSQYEHLGLGNDENLDSLKIHWLSGHTDTFYDIQANQTLLIEEGSSLSPEIQSSEGLSVCDGNVSTLSVGDFLLYEWSNGSINSEIEIFESGTYWVTITTEHGLTATSEAVYIQFLPEMQMDVQISNVSCAGGMDGWANIEIANGPGLYEVSWGEDVYGSFQENLAVGYYSFNALDSTGCSSEGEIFISEPQPLTTEITVVEVSCFGFTDGHAEINVSGGTPGYFIDWEGGNPEALPAGSTFAIVTDTAGCELIIEITISEPDLIVMSLLIEYMDGLGVVSINPSGGTPPFQIEWSNGVLDNLIIDNLGSGSYEVAVTDSSGCMQSEVFVITDLSNIEIFETIIGPNPFKDWIHLNFRKTFSGSMSLFDSSGKLVVRHEIVSKIEFSISTTNLPAGNYTLVIGTKPHQLLKH